MNTNNAGILYINIILSCPNAIVDDIIYSRTILLTGRLLFTIDLHNRKVNTKLKYFTNLGIYSFIKKEI